MTAVVGQQVQLADMRPEVVIDAHEVTKTYPVRPPVTALRGVTMCVRAGERVAVVGRSGAGKSTLLNILGLLDTPTSGRYELLGQDSAGMSARGRDAARAEHLGFVFQENHILGHRTVAENIDLKLAVLGVRPSQRAQLIDDVLERVGLAGHRLALGRLLSGGEKQRLAIARAIVGEPRAILADEPTGNLDEDNAHNVMELLDAQADAGAAVVVITHDPRLAAWARRVVDLTDGRAQERVWGSR
jgi:putative ABC transport system ATP-binding protein